MVNKISKKFCAVSRLFRKIFVVVDIDHVYLHEYYDHIRSAVNCMRIRDAQNSEYIVRTLNTALLLTADGGAALEECRYLSADNIEDVLLHRTFIAINSCRDMVTTEFAIADDDGDGVTDYFYFKAEDDTNRKRMANIRIMKACAIIQSTAAYYKRRNKFWWKDFLYVMFILMLTCGFLSMFATFIVQAVEERQVKGQYEGYVQTSSTLVNAISLLPTVTTTVVNTITSTTALVISTTIYGITYSDITSVTEHPNPVVTTSTSMVTATATSTEISDCFDSGRLYSYAAGIISLIVLIIIFGTISSFLTTKKKRYTIEEIRRSKLLSSGKLN